MKRFLCIFLTISLVVASLACALAEPEAGGGTQAAGATALFEEGKDYWYGINGKAYDRDLAIERFRAAADGGCADAWYYLGNVALTESDENRYQTALDCYRKAAELGSLLALYGEGLMYLNGRGVEVDAMRAKALFEEAIAAGCTEVNSALSEMYILAQGVEQDGQAAITCAEKALEGEDFQLRCRAMIYIACVYENAIGVEQDYTKTVEWYQKCADAGYYAGYGNLGNCYLDGTGVEKDLEKAIQLYEKAAEKGSCDTLAWCYYNGIGVEQDYAKAMELYLRNLNSPVTNLGSGSNASYWYIATMYRDGLGTEQDYATALEWYLKGVRDGDPDCMTNAADLYRDGIGTEKNPDRAVELYEMAAKNDSAYACGQLGYLYQTGNGVEQSFEKAIAWYEKGSALGNGYCLGQLGWIYLYGKGVDPDYEKARGYFEKGAEKEREYCYEKLGEIYNEGKGVEKDPEKAAEYYRIALDKAAENRNDAVAKRSVKALKALGKTVDKITITDKQLTLLTGGPDEAAQAQLTCTITPEATFWKDAVWSSSDENIATVDENGVVHAVATGKATITAVTTQPLSTAKAATVKVTVKQAVTGIEPDSAAITLPVKKSASVKTTVIPAEAANKKLEWTSENEAIATVKANGQIAGKGTGTTTVTAKATDGSGVTASIQVTVIQPVSKVTLKEKSLSLTLNTDWQLTYQVLPEEATDKTILWTSDNEAVAVVNESGVISAVGIGKCNITGTANDGSGTKVKIKVSVKE